jgi:WD40 repeat protein/tRNA A-37 threonylcarbamoyl transferase component Bud32
MTPSPDREEALFTHALGMPAPERKAFLDRECPGDADLRQRLDALLAAHEQPDTLIGPLDAVCMPADIAIGIDLGTSPDAASALPRLRNFGDYDLLEEIARGGMGIVYKARQTSLNRIVAVKMIRAGVFASELDITRFHAEAQAAAGLRHPNIIAIHEVGEHDERHYFSMDYVEGRNLAELVRQHPWSATRAARCLRAIAEAVHYAHERGILHRDLKPSNVIVDALDEPHLTDFGLAIQIEGASALTLSGVILGTPSYMAPEQTGGRRAEIGVGTDVYALGAILYELLTGRAPYQGESPLDTIKLVRDADPVSPRRLNPCIPRDLETIALRCLDKEPKRRYGTALELAEDLGRFLRHEPIRARPTQAWEHGLKWIHRNPWKAALAGAGTLAVLAALRLWLEVETNQRLTALNVELTAANTRAEDAQRQTEKALTAANLAYAAEARQRMLAEDARDEARLLDYVNRILLARQAWEVNNLAEADRLLDTCPDEFRHWEWHYLKRLCRSDIAVVARLTESTNGPSPVAVSPNGTQVASVGSAGEIQVLNLANNQLFTLPHDHGTNITSLALAAQSPLLAFLSWSLESRGALAVVQFDTTNTSLRFQEFTGVMRALAFADNDRLVISAGDDGLIAWDCATGARRWQVEVPSGETGLSVVVSRDNQFAAWITGSRLPEKDKYGVPQELMGDAIRIVEAGTGRSRRVITEEFGEVRSINISPDSKRLASGHDGGVVRLWNLEAGIRERSFRHGHGSIDALAFTAAGTGVIAGSGSGMTAYFAISNPEDPTAHLYRLHRGPVRAVCPTPDGSSLLSVGADGTVRRWPIDHQQDGLRTPSKGRTLAFLDDERLLVSDGSIHSASSGSPLGQEPWAADWQGDRVSVTHDGEWASLGGVVRPVSPDGPIEGPWSRVTRRAQHHRYPAAFGNSGKLFAARGWSDHFTELSEVRILTTSTWDKIAAWSPTTNGIWDAAFTPDDRHLALAIGDYTRNGSQGEGLPGEVQLWDWRESRLVRVFPAMRFSVWGVAITRNGQRLASAGGLYMPFRYMRAEPHGEIQVWDLETGKMIFDLPGVPDNVFTLAFSPDGQRLVAAVGKHGPRGVGLIKIWEMQRGLEVLTLDGFNGPVSGVAFSPNGERIAAIGSGVRSGMLRIFTGGPPGSPSAQNP